MVNIKLKKLVCIILAAVITFEAPAIPLLRNYASVSYASEWEGIVQAERLNVRSGAGTEYDAVAVLNTNTKITVIGETTGTDGQKWYNVRLHDGKTGYARHDFIRRDQVYSAADSNFEQWMNDQGFPESYKNGLRGLHEKYPNWIFKAQHTGLDWNTVIAEESKVGRNLIDKNSKSSWKSIEDGAFDWASNSWPGFDGSAWNAASSEIISHYMDPRNFLTDPYIFQFEIQTYNPSIHTRDGLMQLIKGTFLDSEAIVPIEGSIVEAGTPVYGVTQNIGNVNGTGESQGSYIPNPDSYGPGYSSEGPGSNINSSNNNGSSYLEIGPGASDNSISLVGPGVLSIFSTIGSSLFNLLGGIDAYAGEWKRESKDPLVWVYINDDGSKLSNGWYWLDANKDGIAECYYLYPDGAMAYNTIVDGYMVNAEGKWVDSEGKVYTKNSSEIQNPGTSQETAVFKKVHYADLIMKAAEVSGVSPYALASMILQEQGTGKSDSISGTNQTYPGYYNYYNLGAYAHDGMGAIEAGLKFASEHGNADRPWNTIEKSIIGGAKAYGANYVLQGQDNFYLKKFNVQGDNKYNHQYMTNVPAAAAEGAKLAACYNEGIKSTPLEFKIPVYNNMPETPCPMPVIDGNPNNKLSNISVDGYTITPTFNMNTTEYSLIVDGGVNTVNINVSTIDQNATVSGAGQVNLVTGVNEINIEVTAQNGTKRLYKLNITKKPGGEQNIQPDPSVPQLPPTSNPMEPNVSVGGSTDNSQNSSVEIGPGASSGDVIIGSTPPGL
ncbi:MAG: SH3 domain-containing protein [Eubacteriales bacterium]|nr:SH3 domain-containing protein [Eubacteriales bacterium]